MPSYVTPKKNTEYIFFVGLVSQADTKILKANPTLAAADFNVSTDGGALGALGTTPTVTPASGRMVKITLSAGEMNGDNVTVVCSDSAGAEWCDLIINIQTSARQVDDLAWPTTTGRSIDVAATGEVGLDFNNILSTSLVTLNSLTITGATTFTGVTTHTGNVVLSDGLTISAPSTLNRAGFSVTGTGTGAAIVATAGATGIGVNVVGGSTSGDGIKVTTTSGHGLNLAPVGTSMHGILATGGNGGTSDGIKGAAGTGGVDIRGNITGNLVGTVSTLTTNNDKTGYSIAAGGVGSGAIAAAELNNIADGVLDRNMTTGTDSGTDSTVTRTVRQALRILRNKTAISGGTLTCRKEDDVTASWTAAITTTAGDPISAVDPT